MTLREIELSDKNVLTPRDVADVLGCHHYSINVQAQDDPSKLGFPVMVHGRRVTIPRLPFIEWMKHCHSQENESTDGDSMTVDEAVRLWGHRDMRDIRMIHALRNVFECSYPRLSVKERDEDDLYLSTFFSVVWNAGRVQGIREERKRRRLELVQPE